MISLVYDVLTERYESARIEGASFDKALPFLAADHLVVIPVEVNARLRIALGPQDFVSRKGNYVAQAIIRASPDDVYIPESSPVLASAERATAAHRNHKPFLLTQEEMNLTLEGAVRISRLEIPFNELAHDPVGRYLFGEAANAYGAFLQENLSKEGIHAILIRPPVDVGEANQLWFGRLGKGSGLDGDDRGLYYEDCVRVVRGATTAAEVPRQI